MSYYSSHTQTSDGEPFHCSHCNQLVLGQAPGTSQRNHCPHCLWSRHVDFQAGDRRSACRSPMEPIAVWARPNGEWSLIHRCTRCGAIRANRIAGDDNELALVSLAFRAAANPAFPLERIKIP